ncbi:hypothetical protein CH337_12920 [Rhodoblastus acidophilus]|nr:hypothetical protein CKO16_15085 [Rhodoblastus acidophilus]RAI19055.1 hypothetical protein CH337_12920 [Rhodoblastus acidophilus]
MALRPAPPTLGSEQIMAENILSRVRRLVSGGVEDLIDSMEKAGGESVMREAIREVDRALDDARAETGRAAARKAQAFRQVQMVSAKLKELEGKAKFALEQNREDLAEAAIARQVDLEAQVPVLEAAGCEAGEEEEHLHACVAALAARKRQMEADFAALAAARREASAASGAAADATYDDGIVEKAQRAFDRAMDLAGGAAGPSAIEPKTAKQLAEIEALERSEKINARLTALKADLPR